jgi:hypothetical protein
VAPDIVAPQPPQNLLLAGFSMPQAPQAITWGAPHAPQKRLSTEFSTPQAGQFIKRSQFVVEFTQAN